MGFRSQHRDVPPAHGPIPSRDYLRPDELDHIKTIEDQLAAARFYAGEDQAKIDDLERQIEDLKEENAQLRAYANRAQEGLRGRL